MAGVRIASTPWSNTVLEVALDQRADLAGAVVIGVVEARRQHIGADHDPALHLGAEAFGAGLFIHLGDAVALPQLGAAAVAHAVVAREVRRRLGRRDHVIGGQRVFGVRQRDVDDLGARVAQHRRAVGPELLDLGGHAVHAVFARDADHLAPDVAGQRGLEIGHGQVGGWSNPSGRARPSRPA